MVLRFHTRVKVGGMVVLYVVIAALLAALVALGVVILRMQAWRREYVRLPEVKGVPKLEILWILSLAAKIEYPITLERYPLKRGLSADQIRYMWVGRPKGSFSRRTCGMVVGRKRYESIRDEFVRQGLLTVHGARRGARWTEKGRLLLLQVKAGMFGKIPDLYHVDAGK